MRISKYVFFHIELILFFITATFYSNKNIIENIFIMILISLTVLLLLDLITKKLGFNKPKNLTILFDLLLILLVVNSLIDYKINYLYIITFVILYPIKVFFVKENKILTNPSKLEGF